MRAHSLQLGAAKRRDAEQKAAIARLEAALALRVDYQRLAELEVETRELGGAHAAAVQRADAADGRADRARADAQRARAGDCTHASEVVALRAQLAAMQQRLDGYQAREESRDQQGAGDVLIGGEQ